MNAEQLELPTLTFDEFHVAAVHAVFRRVHSRQKNRTDPTVCKKNVWDNEIEAACAELAWCKHCGVFWSGLGNVRAGDAGLIEIRWTLHTEIGGLGLRSTDQDEAQYVLIVGRAPQFIAVGWLFGYEAKQAVYYNEKFGEFLVPRAHLRQISTLEPMANLDAEVRAKECIS